MDRQELISIIEEVLVKYNTATKITEPSEKLLVIMECGETDNDIYNKIINSFSDNHVYFFIENMNTHLDKNINVIEEECIKDINYMINEFSSIFIYNPTIKLLSKINNIIIDNYILELLFTFLEKEKTTYISNYEKMDSFTNSMKAKIADIYEKVLSYGLVKKDIYANKKITCTDISKKKVISFEDVQKIQTGNVLNVNKYTIITPLANDYIKEKNIILKIN